MPVPNTNTFTLQDVADELNPFEDTLQKCFDISIDSEFDSTYGGSGYGGTGTGTDRQSNFRNYGLGLKWIYLEPWEAVEDGHIWDALNIAGGNDQGAWDDVHDHVSGMGIVDNEDYYAAGSKRDKSGGIYDMFISRVFLSFNLTLITQTIIASKMLFRVVSEIGLSRLEAGRGSYGDTLELYDYSTSFTNIMSQYIGQYTQGDSSIVKSIKPISSAEASIVNAATGNLFHVSIRQHNDWVDIKPTVVNEMRFWRDGTETGDYVWKPQLRLQYSGAHMLEIGTTLWEPATPADNTYIYLVASEGNNWDAVVSVGDTWLTVTAPTSDDGTRFVRINVIQNTGAPRDGTVTFDNLSADKVLTVNQAGVPECTGSPDPYNAVYYDANQMITVVAYPDTNAWTASFVNTGDGIGWIHFVGGNTGTGDGNFTINCDDNDGTARSCDIKLESDATSDYLVDVDQAAGGINGGSLTIDNGVNDTDSTNIDVTPNTMSTTVSAVDTGHGTSWFRITSGAAETGDFTLTIILFGTPPTSNKSAQVRIDDDVSGIYKLVAVNYSYII